jgi:hypothetical protein
MLGAEFFGPSENRTCCRIEPFPESPIISRGVIGTFGESNGKSHRRNSNHASIRPELVRILHVLFPLLSDLGERHLGAASSSITASTRPVPVRSFISSSSVRGDHCPEHHSSAADHPRGSRKSHVQARVYPTTIMARAGTTCHGQGPTSHGGPRPSRAGREVARATAVGGTSPSHALSGPLTCVRRTGDPAICGLRAIPGTARSRNGADRPDLPAS